jgi:hypothetical protein
VTSGTFEKAWRLAARSRGRRAVAARASKRGKLGNVS